MVRRDCPPKASAMAAVSLGSILNASAMICVATEMESASSAGMVPSVQDLLRKSMTARARRLVDSPAYRGEKVWVSIERVRKGKGSIPW